MGGIGILLHLKRVVLDVVYGREDDAGVVLLHSGQDGFSPFKYKKDRSKRTSHGMEDETSQPIGKSWKIESEWGTVSYGSNIKLDMLSFCAAKVQSIINATMVEIIGQEWTDGYVTECKCKMEILAVVSQKTM